MQQNGLSDFQLSTMFIVSAAATIMGQMPITFITNRIGQRWAMILGQFLKMVAILLWLAWPTYAGFVVGMLVNWILSISFVFRAVRNKEEATSAKSFGVFVIISVIGLVLTLLGVWLLAKAIPTFEFLGKTDFFGTTWSKWVAKMIMTCIVLVWNYIGRKIFIFKS